MSASGGMVAGPHNRNEFVTIRRDGDAPTPTIPSYTREYIPRRSKSRKLLSEPTSGLERVEVEKAKQDDAISDLSDILTELKGMAIDMGSETSRQTSDLGHVEKDFDELNFRVKGENT